MTTDEYAGPDLFQALAHVGPLAHKAVDLVIGTTHLTSPPPCVAEAQQFLAVAFQEARQVLSQGKSVSLEPAGPLETLGQTMGHLRRFVAGAASAPEYVDGLRDCLRQATRVLENFDRLTTKIVEVG